MLDATGPDNFAVRLFLDKTTHLPLMLTYKSQMRRMAGGGPVQMRHGASPAEMDKMAKEMADKAGPPQEVEQQIRFSEYRKVGALLLPHRISQGEDGQVREEWEVTNFDLRAERGPAAQDVRHFFSAMINRQLVRNLNLMVIASGNSARPYNVTTGRDDNADTVFTDRPVGVGRNSARGDSRFEVTTRLAYGFDFGGKRAEEAAAAGGGTPRAIRIGPGGADGLPSAGSQKYRLELFVSASNLLNTANLSGYSGVAASPFFGRATSALPGRRIETGFRFSL